MSFGQNILDATTDAVLATERECGVSPPFPEIDAITTELVMAAFEGKRVAVIEEREKRNDLELPPLTGDERAAVARVFTLPAQQSRGAWFLPEEAAVRPGWANLPHYFSKYARFAAGASRDEKAAVTFGNDPDALYFWAVLEPLFQALLAPFDYRGPTPPKGDANEQQEAWAGVDAFYTALNIDGGEPLRRMRYGSGWSRLKTGDQLEIKHALLAQIRGCLRGDLGARYRAWSTMPLIERFYAKAKKAPPLMRQVLTKPLQRTLSAFFGGDWLAFVAYLGEQLHPEEQISSSLPEPRLYVDVRDRASTVASAHGVSTSEVERIIATFWASETADSPVHRRVDVLRQCWSVFDAAHANQVPGMATLWGLVEDHELVELEQQSERDPRGYNRGLYRERIPTQLLAAITELWGGVFLTSYPESIITAIDPYARMCEALGPALRFWNGLGLTSWFVAEGPMSRTDMKSAQKYYAKDLDALSALNCPVDLRIFPDLISAEAALGPEEPYEEDVEQLPISEELGFSLRISVSTGSRRAGFERLRDVVTRYRRDWTAKHFEQYLRARWETELKAAAREFNKLFEVKRKAPTLKQFAKHAAEPTNRWFGGDVSQLYRALGEKSPVSPTRRRFLKEPSARFAQRTFAALGGVPTTWEDLAKTIVGSDREQQDAAWRAHQSRESLATLSLKFVQLREALDRAPTLKEFGVGSFKQHGAVLDPELLKVREEYDRKLRSGQLATYEPKPELIESAWERYSEAIERCLAASAGS